MNSRKAFSSFLLVSLLISIIVLIILIKSGHNFLSDYHKKQEILNCNRFINSVNGDEIYFKENNYPTQKFVTLVTKLCRFQSYDFNSDKDIPKIANSVYDCWIKFDKGKDFTGSNTDIPIAVLCSEINVNTNTKYFNEKITKEFSKTRYSSLFVGDESNLNNVSLSKYFQLQELKKNQKLYIYFIIIKKRQNNMLTKGLNYFLGKISHFKVSYISSLSSLINNKFLNSDYVSFVVITDKTPQKTISQKNVNIIIPEMMK